MSIPTVALDDILSDRVVDIIKMDLEGSEFSALKGAKNLISGQMPFLAICVYHRDDDFLTIPPYIQELARQGGKKYKFYLRHHGVAYGTVLYAVPD